MQTKHAAAALVVVAIAGLNAGCGTTDLTDSQKQANEIAEIRVIVNKQQEDIAALHKMLDSTGGNAQLFNAAALLARNCQENQSATAISLLGAIGGPKAEPILLEMLETASTNQYSAILSALNNIHSQKLHDIIIKLIADGNSQQFSAAVNELQNNRNIIQKSDLPAIEKALEKYPNDNYNNNRYLRNVLLGTILRLDQEKGIQYICEDLQTAPYNQKQEIIYSITNHQLTLSFSAWKKIIESLNSPDASNIDVYYAILNGLGQTGDWRVSDLILPWVEFAATNDNFCRQYFGTLLKLRDPQSAQTVLDLYQQLNLPNQPSNPRKFSGRSISRGENLDNYPGIKKVDDNYILVDDATMQKLLEQRAAKIKLLNELDKKRAAKS